jgi:hypothetical protein
MYVFRTMHTDPLSTDLFDPLVNPGPTGPTPAELAEQLGARERELADVLAWSVTAADLLRRLIDCYDKEAVDAVNNPDRLARAVVSCEVGFELFADATDVIDSFPPPYCESVGKRVNQIRAARVLAAREALLAVREAELARREAVIQTHARATTDEPGSWAWAAPRLARSCNWHGDCAVDASGVDLPCPKCGGHVHNVSAAGQVWAECTSGCGFTTHPEGLTAEDFSR